jgi:hypothetical protein
MAISFVSTVMAVPEDPKIKDNLCNSVYVSLEFYEGDRGGQDDGRRPASPQGRCLLL